MPKRVERPQVLAVRGGDGTVWYYERRNREHKTATLLRLEDGLYYTTFTRDIIVPQTIMNDGVEFQMKRVRHGGCAYNAFVVPEHQRQLNQNLLAASIAVHGQN
jgi:hypothetical protein